jgi:putative FmdB family regulatory protein
VPTYDYRCRDCGHTIEIVHSILEDGPEACERCRGPVERVLHPAGVIFRGSGFYVTDSRAGNSARGGGSDGSGSGSPTSSSGGKDSGSKDSSAGGKDSASGSGAKDSSAGGKGSGSRESGSPTGGSD